jgi:hypothetical protein
VFTFISKLFKNAFFSPTLAQEERLNAAGCFLRWAALLISEKE